MNTASQITVRRAKPEDAIILATLRFEFRSAIGEAIEPSDAFIGRCESWMHERLSSDVLWCAWIAETVDERGALAIGAVWLQFIEKIPNPVGEKEAHAYITNLFVLEAERGHGAGSKLLEAAVAECAAVDVDTIILWPTPPSRSLYERHGFGPAAAVMARIL